MNKKHNILKIALTNRDTGRNKNDLEKKELNIE